MKVATHNGEFHADEVFAIATLRLAGEWPEVIRTRDEELMAGCDLRVDVGLRSDPATGDFDHHQPGGGGTRTNGVPYASFGLIWRHYGARACGGNEAVALRVDQKLVQSVDANDNGRTLAEPLQPDALPATVDRSVMLFNPVWDAPASEEERLYCFWRAVDLAEQLILCEIAHAAAWLRAQHLVTAALAEREDPRLLVLDERLPWREMLFGLAPEVLLVVAPAGEGWSLESAPAAPGVFGNKLDLPAAWAGQTGAVLAQTTGVPGAVFCHTRLFYAAARTRLDALALAALALAAD